MWYSMENFADDLLLGSKANFSFQLIPSYVWYSMENLAGDLLLGSKANFSFQLIASYVWCSMENLAGDLLFGLKLVKLSILPILFTQFVYGTLGELRSIYLGFNGVESVFFRSGWLDSFVVGRRDKNP